MLMFPCGLVSFSCEVFHFTSFCICQCVFVCVVVFAFMCVCKHACVCMLSLFLHSCVLL